MRALLLLACLRAPHALCAAARCVQHCRSTLLSSAELTTAGCMHMCGYTDEPYFQCMLSEPVCLVHRLLGPLFIRAGMSLLV